MQTLSPFQMISNRLERISSVGISKIIWDLWYAYAHLNIWIQWWEFDLMKKRECGCSKITKKWIQERNVIFRMQNCVVYQYHWSPFQYPFKRKFQLIDLFLQTFLSRFHISLITSPITRALLILIMHSVGMKETLKMYTSS